MTYVPTMDERDARRRCSSPRARRSQRRRSSSSSRDSSSSPERSGRSSRRDLRSRRRNSSSRSRSRSPHGYRRRNDRRSDARDSRDAARRGDTFLVAQRGNRHGEERRIRRVDRANATGEVQRIAPNASALKSIMLGTARSRDRMDERERAQAKKKLENLTAKTQ